MTLDICSPAEVSSAPLSPAQRLRQAIYVSKGVTSKPDCSIDVHIGVFFDGTNNNKERDQLNVPDPNGRSHSNIVVLHDSFADIRQYHYGVYLPGVGTIFREVGDLTETSEGKAMARGGEARIFWAMIQVLNGIHQAIYKNALLVQDDEATKAVAECRYLVAAASRRNSLFTALG